MNKIFINALIIFLFASSLFALNNVKDTTAALVQESDKLWCPVTGLSIEKYYETSYKAELKTNKKQRIYSSLFALVKDMKKHEIDQSSIQVFDQIEQKYVPVLKAYFIIESNKKGTLSKVSKFAFSSQKEAMKFQNRYKGRLVHFDEALQIAKKNFQSDEEHFLKIKKKKEYPRGKKVFEKECKKDIDPTEYLEINELKSAIVYNNLCKPLKEQDLQALALYLWEVKRFGTLKSIGN